MNIHSRCEDIRKQVHQYKGNNETIALVPTMGHLHAGHLSLIELAKSHATRVIVSIFINPMQFNQNSDFTSYPRSPEQDIEKLTQLDVDALFTPDTRELFPQGTEQSTKIVVTDYDDILEGEFRPGHFAGVCTIVCKLFNIITPNIAVFGSKDYQQLLIIRRMAHDLNLNVDIIAGPTIREQNGLAMSSRNSRLSTKQFENAKEIHRVSLETMTQFSVNNITSLEENAVSTLEKCGFRVEYFAIRDASNLAPVTQDTENVVILAAAWLGDTRLIDNHLFPKP